MELLEPSEILNLVEYEHVGVARRCDVIALKQTRHPKERAHGAHGRHREESPGRPRVRVALLMVAVLALAVGGCSESGLSPSAERGRQVYLAHCVACHQSDPAQSGPVGPPVKGSSRALLEAKVLGGTYPPGYPPKRPTKIMTPLPALTPDIEALADYLR